MRKSGGDEEPAFNKPREDLAKSQKKEKAKNEKGHCYGADAETPELWGFFPISKQKFSFFHFKLWPIQGP